MQEQDLPQLRTARRASLIDQVIDQLRSQITSGTWAIGGRIPTESGLGNDLNWSEVDKHPYRKSNFLPLFKVGWERREGSTLVDGEGAVANA